MGHSPEVARRRGAYAVPHLPGPQGANRGGSKESPSMSQAPLRLRPPRPALALLATGIAGLAGAAGAQANLAPPATRSPDVMVAIHAQHYLWAGRTFDTLETLATTVLPRTPQSLGLRACGTQATPALLAAASRFRHLELHLTVGAADAPPCLEREARSTRAALREEASASRLDDEAVRAWWQQCMP
jgi:hypothetical protein